MDDRINVYEYTDFHRLMRDLWLREKRNNKEFSHRHMADKLGVRSSAFFQNTVAGRKKLSMKILPRVCSLFELNRAESEYFRLLVSFNQSEDIAEKKQLLTEIADFFKDRLKLQGVNRFEFYRKWYHNAIRSLLGFYTFKGDYKELAMALDPYIRLNQARDAIEVLEKLGAIERTDDGDYKPASTAALPGGPDELTQVAANEFQHVMATMAHDAIDKFEPAEREFSSITVGMSEGVYRTVLQQIAELRERIVDMAGRDPSPERVYQMNFQVFPLSRKLADFGLDPEELAERRRSERAAAALAAETELDDDSGMDE